MKIKDFQDRIRELYYKRDNERGIEKTFLWLVEEIGELSEALRKNDNENIEEEIADVIAWTVSIANLKNLDLVKLLEKKYEKLCFYCRQNPCKCTKE